MADDEKTVYSFVPPPPGTDPDEVRRIILANLEEADVPAESASSMADDMVEAWKKLTDG